ncbi:MAG: DUF6152 family protein [Pseudomonadales bacterium]|nr:DUF6152 family protein [Pseudomonadales bacterium]
MRIARSLLPGLGTLILSASALAHHSFSAQFDVGRPVNLTGTVMNVEWTNPHAWVFIETEDKAGEPQRWAIELLGINSLMRSGMTPDTVKPGVQLTIKGFGARDGTNTANASSVIHTETGRALWASAREKAN